jgi:Uma2 family endonuclease
MVQTLQEPTQQITRLRMSWEDYLRLPEKPKAEYVDGEVLIMPPVPLPHARTVYRLSGLFIRELPDLDGGPEVGLHLPGNRLRAPDLMLVESPPIGGTWVTDPPVLVVEVLSPATRAEDTGPKMAEYAEGGVGQYWLVDPAGRTIDVLRNDNGHWTQIFHLDDTTPAGQVQVTTSNPGTGGTVTVNLSAILET